MATTATTICSWAGVLSITWAQGWPWCCYLSWRKTLGCTFQRQPLCVEPSQGAPWSERCGLPTTTYITKGDRQGFSVTACKHSSTGVAAPDWQTHSCLRAHWLQRWTSTRSLRAYWIDDKTLLSHRSNLKLQLQYFCKLKLYPCPFVLFKCVCILLTFVCPSPCSSLASATSSVEELPRIFSRERKLPWNTAQQLYDVGYVVYIEERKRGRKRWKEERTRGWW